MIKKHISDFHRGWFIGDFEKAVLRTPDFEVALIHHRKGEMWPAHFHKESTEYNVLISGRMSINNIEMLPNDVFIIEKGEISVPVFHEDCKVLCVKVPSIPSDKYMV